MRWGVSSGQQLELGNSVQHFQCLVCQRVATNLKMTNQGEQQHRLAWFFIYYNFLHCRLGSLLGCWAARSAAGRHTWGCVTAAHMLSSRVGGGRVSIGAVWLRVFFFARWGSLCAGPAPSPAAGHLYNPYCPVSSGCPRLGGRDLVGTPPHGGQNSSSHLIISWKP